MHRGRDKILQFDWLIFLYVGFEYISLNCSVEPSLTTINPQILYGIIQVSNRTSISLSVSLPELYERSYGAYCRVYTPEKSNKFSNVYVSISKSKSAMWYPHAACVSEEVVS